MSKTLIESALKSFVKTFGQLSAVALFAPLIIWYVTKYEKHFYMKMTSKE